MSNSPGSWLEDKLLDFRAPPPSPMATGYPSTFANESVLAEFLRKSLKVPELVLPDKVVPRQKLHVTPPTIDLKWLNSLEYDGHVSELIECASRIGCFELINHEISEDLIKEVVDECRGLFDPSRKEKDNMRKLAGMVYGFDEEENMGDEFVWGRDKELMLKLELRGYLNFSAKMEILSSIIDKLASNIVHHLEKQNGWTSRDVEYSMGSLCCIYKHNELEVDKTLDEWDVIRKMLNRSSAYSHAIGIHICSASSEFHIYSKQGWVSFVPQKNALVVTLGDLIEAWSGGVHRHVTGKPIIFKGDNSDEKGNIISMAFLHSPSPHPTKKQNPDDAGDETIITIGQQLYFSILLALAYQFFVYLCSLF